MSGLTTCTLTAYSDSKTLTLDFGEAKFNITFNQGDCIEKVKNQIGNLLIDIEAAQRNRTSNE